MFGLKKEYRRLERNYKMKNNNKQKTVKKIKLNQIISKDLLEDNGEKNNTFNVIDKKQSKRLKTISKSQLEKI